MLIFDLFVLFVIIKCSFCKTSLRTYPMVDLLENSPKETFILSLERSLNVTNPRKLVLLNYNGYERNFFSIRNENVYTNNLIDREEFVNKKYCSDHFYCQIEVHILVNDGLEYLIIPIHILDENDNKAEFRKNEMKMKLYENIPNGYQIPFEGAKDIDEGENREIKYILDCSNTTSIPVFNQSSINCFPLFELMILSQSSSSSYDQLALKFHPLSSSLKIENEYQLKVYAIDHNNQYQSSMNLKVEIEEKEKGARFSLSKYEFVVVLNSSLTKNNKSNVIGRVYAIPNKSFERIYYQIIGKNNETNCIEINSLTGELYLIIINENKMKSEMEFDVQASTLSSSSKELFITKSKVKIVFRYLSLLKEISFEYKINLSKSNEILQINKSNSFLIDQNLNINESLFELMIISFNYPLDQYILSLDNYIHLFSLLPSSSKTNIYLLKTRQHLISTSIYLLNIGVKHKLSQQWLPNLRIELIIVDQWTKRITTTTTTTTREKQMMMKNETTMNMIISSDVRLLNDSVEFCKENTSYIVYEINKMKEKNEIGLVKVIQSNSIRKNNSQKMFYSVNGSEMIVDECRMSIDELNHLFNKSFEYELCLFSLSLKRICYNITMKDSIEQISTINQHLMKKWFLSMKSIEIIMFILSMIFIFIAILLIIIICRLRDFQICLKFKKNIFYKNHYGTKNIQQQHSSSSSRMKEGMDSIVVRDSSSSSFQSIRIKHVQIDPSLYHIDDLFYRESLPASNMFVLSSVRQSSPSLSFRCSLERGETIQLNNDYPLLPPPRTSSSSSFLHETKQLLEMISSNQNFDLSKLVSEV